MKREEGFTLIELVVSVAVLSLVMLPFFGIFTNAAKLDARSKNEMTANYLAQRIATEFQTHNSEIGSWVESDEGTHTLYTNDDLSYMGSGFSEFSANVRIDDPLTLSVNAEGNLTFNPDNYDAVLLIQWDESTKSIEYTYDGLTYSSETLEDTSSNFELVLSGEASPFTLHSKVNADDPWFTMSLYASGATSLAILLDEAYSPNGQNTITIENDTGTNKNPAIEILTYVNQHDNIAVVAKGNGSGVEINPFVEDGITTSTLSVMTVEVTGYDPVSGTSKILKRLFTSVHGNQD